MKVRKCAFAVVLVALVTTALPTGGVADPAPVIGTRPVDDSFIETRLRWSGAEGTGFVLRWSVIAVEGDTVICGIVHYPNARTRRQSRDVLRRSFVLFDGKQVMRDLRFVSVARRLGDMDSSIANCAGSGVKARAGARIQVGWDAGRARM